MAKFKDYKYTINGVEKKAKIDVDKFGKFAFIIDVWDWEVLGSPIELHLTQRYSTLYELEAMIESTFNNYYNSKMEYSLHLGVYFRASGYFAKGFEKFEQKGYVGACDNTIAFDYELLIKRTSEGEPVWYDNVVDILNTEPERADFIERFKSQYVNVDNFYSRDIVRTGLRCDLVLDYSPSVHDSLQAAKDGFQTIAAKLHDLFGKPQEELITILSNTKLISK